MQRIVVPAAHNLRALIEADYTLEVDGVEYLVRMWRQAEYPFERKVSFYLNGRACESPLNVHRWYLHMDAWAPFYVMPFEAWDSLLER